jgi:hypothetical protein
LSLQYRCLKIIFFSEIDPNAFKSLILSSVEDHFGIARQLALVSDKVAGQKNKEALLAKVTIVTSHIGV